MKSPLKHSLSVLLLSETFLASNALSSNFNGRSQKSEFDASKGATGKSSNDLPIPSKSGLPSRTNGWSTTPHVIGPDQWLNSVSLSRSPNYFPQSWSGPTNGRSSGFSQKGGNNSLFSQPSTTASEPPASNGLMSNGQSPITASQLSEEKSQKPVSSTTSWTQASISNGAMQADVIKKVGLYDYQTSNPWSSAEAQAARMAEQARNARLLAEENVRRLKAEAEAEAKRLEEQQKRKAAAEEEARARKAAEEIKRQRIAAEEEKVRLRKAAEEEERRRIAIEEEARARKAAEETERQRIAAEEEKARRRKAAEEEEARARKAVEEQEKQRIAAEEEKARLRKAAEEEEMQRIAVAEEKSRPLKISAEEEARARKAVEEKEKQRSAVVQEEARLRKAAEEEEARTRKAATEEEARARMATEEMERQGVAEVEEEVRLIKLGAEEEAQARDSAAKEEEMRLIAAAEEQWRKRVAADKEEKRRLQVQAEAEAIQQMAEKARLARLAAEENVRRLKVEAEAEAARLSAKQRSSKNGSLINSHHSVDAEDETVQSWEASPKEEEKGRNVEEACRRIPVAAENEAHRSQAQTEAEAIRMAEKVRNARLRAEDNLRRLKVEIKADSAHVEQQCKSEANLVSTERTASDNSIRLLKHKSPSNKQPREARSKLTSLRPRPKGFSVLNENKKKTPKEKTHLRVTEQRSQSTITGLSSETKLESDSKEVEEQLTLEKAEKFHSGAIDAAKHDESTRRALLRSRLSDEAKRREIFRQQKVEKVKAAKARATEATRRGLLQFRLSDEARRREIFRRQEEARVKAEKAREEEETRLAAIATANHDESTRRGLLQFRLSDESKRREIARQQEEERVKAEKARAEEEARLAAITAAKRDEATRRGLLQFRLFDESKRREIARQQEEERVKAEKARAEEEARLAAITAAKRDEATRRGLLQFRLSDEGKRREIARQQEEERVKAEKARAEEEARLAAITAAKHDEATRRGLLQFRLFDESKRREIARQQEEERERVETDRLREIARLEAIAQFEEKRRLAEQARKEDEARMVAIARQQEIERSKQLARERELARLPLLARLELDTQMTLRPADSPWPTSTVVGSDERANGSNRNVNQTDPSPLVGILNVTDGAGTQSSSSSVQQPNPHSIGADVTSRQFSKSVYESMERGNVKRGSLLSKSRSSPKRKVEQLSQSGRGFSKKDSKSKLKSKRAATFKNDPKKVDAQPTKNAADLEPFSPANSEEISRQDLPRDRLLNGSNATRTGLIDQEAITEASDSAPNSGNGLIPSVTKRGEATRRGLLQHRLSNEASNKRAAQKIEEAFTEIRDGLDTNAISQTRDETAKLFSIAKRQEATHRSLLQHRLLIEANRKQLAQQDIIDLEKGRINTTAIHCASDLLESAAKRQEATHRSLLQHRLMNDAISKKLSRSEPKEASVVVAKVRVNYTETPDRANSEGAVTSAHSHELNQRALLQYRLSSNSRNDTMIEVEKETKAKLAEEEAQAAVELAESILASIDETEIPTRTRKGASFVGSLLSNIERSKETGKLTIEVARGVFNIVSRFLKDVAKDHTPTVSVVNSNDIILEEKEENARIAAEAARLAEEAARLEAARLKKIEEAIEARRKKAQLSADKAAVREDKEMTEHSHTKRKVPFFASLTSDVDSHQTRF